MLIGLAGAVVFMGLVTHWNEFIAWADAHSGFASWAQAFGAVAAILAAFFVADAQLQGARQIERERRADDELQRVAAIEALFINARAICRLFRKVWTDRWLPPGGDFRQVYWQEARDKLARVDPFLCPAPKVIFYLVQAPQQLDQLQSAFEQYMRAIRRDEAEPPHLNSSLDLLDERLSRTAAFLDEAIAYCSQAKQEIELRKGR